MLKRNRAFWVIPQASLCLAMVGCAASEPIRTNDIPAALAVPGTQVLVQRLQANGVQIYQCQTQKNDPVRFEWAFKQPEAALLAKGGRSVGKHYAGPTWEANDGSKVTGTVVARVDSPVAAAIPWLLLGAKTTSGNGIFSNVRSIQRVHTSGGAAPAAGCSQGQLGEELRVAYSADYLFYADNSRSKQ